MLSAPTIQSSIVLRVLCLLCSCLSLEPGRATLWPTVHVTLTSHKNEELKKALIQKVASGSIAIQRLENIDILQEQWIEENQRLSNLGFNTSHYKLSPEERYVLRKYPEELLSVNVVKGVCFLLGEPNAKAEHAGLYWRRLKSMTEKNILNIARVIQCDPPEKQSIQFLKEKAGIVEPAARSIIEDFSNVAASCTLKEDEFDIERIPRFKIFKCCKGFPSRFSVAYFAAKCAKKISEELKHEELTVKYFFSQFCSYNEEALYDALDNQELFHELAVSFLARSADKIALSEFVDPYGVLVWAKLQINSLMDSFSAGNLDIYAPYFPVAQSSGWGKTKLCMRLCEEYHSVYMCCRRAGLMGEPRRSYIADYFLSLFSVVDFQFFYLAFFEAYLEEMVGSNEDADTFKKTFYLKNMEDGPAIREFWDDVQRKCEYYRSTKDISIADGSGFRTKEKVLSSEESIALDDEAGTAKMVDSAFSKLRDHIGQNKSRFLFVFDEFESMLVHSEGGARDPVKFYNWRRAILYMKFKCFNVVLSTTAKLANFAPPSWNDPSASCSEESTLCTSVFIAKC